MLHLFNPLSFNHTTIINYYPFPLVQLNLQLMQLLPENNSTLLKLSTTWKHKKYFLIMKRPSRCSAAHTHTHPCLPVSGDLPRVSRFFHSAASRLSYSRPPRCDYSVADVDGSPFSPLETEGRWLQVSASSR